MARRLHRDFLAGRLSRRKRSRSSSSPPALLLPSPPPAGFVNFLRSRKRDFVSIHLAGNYRQRHMIRVPAYRSPRFMGNACKLREKRLLYLRALPSKAELDMAIVPRTIDTRHVFFLSIPSLSLLSSPSNDVRAEGTETSTRGKRSRVSTVPHCLPGQGSIFG